MLWGFVKSEKINTFLKIKASQAGDCRDGSTVKSTREPGFGSQQSYAVAYNLMRMQLWCLLLTSMGTRTHRKTHVVYRERQRDRQTGREAEIDKDRETDRERDTKRDRETEIFK